MRGTANRCSSTAGAPDSACSGVRHGRDDVLAEHVGDRDRVRGRRDVLGGDLVDGRDRLEDHRELRRQVVELGVVEVDAGEVGQVAHLVTTDFRHGGKPSRPSARGFGPLHPREWTSTCPPYHRAARHAPPSDEAARTRRPDDQHAAVPPAPRNAPVPMRPPVTTPYLELDVPAALDRYVALVRGAARHGRALRRQGQPAPAPARRRWPASAAASTSPARPRCGPPCAPAPRRAPRLLQPGQAPRPPRRGGRARRPALRRRLARRGRTRSPRPRPAARCCAGW